MKNISFLSENFHFVEVKFSIYLNRRVFVMFGTVKCISAVQKTETCFMPPRLEDAAVSHTRKPKLNR